MTPEKQQRKYTEAVLAASAVALTAWELVTLVSDHDSKRTISEVVTEIAHDYPMLPFAMGALCGHWFWSQKPKK